MTDKTVPPGVRVPIFGTIFWISTRVGISGANLLKKRIYSLALIKGTPKTKQSIYENEIELGKIISMENNSILAMLKIELAEKKIYAKQQIKTNKGVVLEFIL